VNVIRRAWRRHLARKEWRAVPPPTRSMLASEPGRERETRYRRQIAAKHGTAEGGWLP